MTDNTSKKLPLVFYTILISVFYILPSIKYSIPYIPLAILLLAGYLFCVDGWKMCKVPEGSIFVCALVLGVMYFFVVNPGNTTEAANEIVRALRCCVPSMLYIVLDRFQCKKGMRLIFMVLTMLMSFVAVKTFMGVLMYPGLARDLAGGLTLDSRIASYRFMNIGGFEFCYAFGVMALFATGVFLLKREIIFRVISVVILTFSIAFMFQVEYVTLLLLFFVFSVILTYRLSDRGIGRLLVAAGIVILIIMIPAIFLQLSNSSLSMISYKFGLFTKFLDSNDVSTLGKRPQYLLAAAKRFLSSPFWGNAAYENGVMVFEAQTVHSTLFGYLQDMGLIGTFCFYYPLFRIHQIIASSMESNRQRILFTTVFQMFLALSVLNPVNFAFEVFFVVFLYIPCGMRTLFNVNEEQ